MDEVIWHAAASSAIAVMGISTMIAGCMKKKEKPAESACSQPPAPLQMPPTVEEKKDGTSTPVDAASKAVSYILG